MNGMNGMNYDIMNYLTFTINYGNYGHVIMIMVSFFNELVIFLMS